MSLEVLVAAWDDVWPHHTRGGLFAVAAELRLKALAAALRDDDLRVVQAALDAGELWRPSDAEVRTWGEERRVFAAVVVQPFVLVCARDAAVGREGAAAD